MPSGDTHDLNVLFPQRAGAPEQKLFGRYTLKRVLGRGGMGIVWMAHDDELHRHVAMKFLPDMLIRDREAVNDLKRETRRSLDLTHHHIVRIYDFTQDDVCAAIIMEYVDGETLSAMKTQQTSGCFSVPVIAAWVAHFCQALDYAHRQARVVHRDLKPANLMVNSRGDLKVTDFGISRSMSDSMTRVSMSNTAGTLAYMSPEQALGAPPAACDDVYAFGATIYDLLTGRPPFFRGNLQVQLETVIPPPMAGRREELGNQGDPIPEVWEEVVAACLAKRPQDRPQTMGEIATLLGVGTPSSSLRTTFLPGSGHGTASGVPGTSSTRARTSPTDDAATRTDSVPAAPQTTKPATAGPRTTPFVSAPRPTELRDVIPGFTDEAVVKPATVAPPPTPLTQEKIEDPTPTIGPESVIVSEAEPVLEVTVPVSEEQPLIVEIEALAEPIEEVVIKPIADEIDFPTIVGEPPEPIVEQLTIAEPAAEEVPDDPVFVEEDAPVADPASVAEEEVSEMVAEPEAEAERGPEPEPELQPQSVPVPEASSYAAIGESLSSPATKTPRRWVPITVIVGVVAIAGIWMAIPKDEHKGQTAATQPTPVAQPTPVPIVSEVQTKLELARNHFANGEWDEAIALVKTVQGLEANNAEAAALLTQIDDAKRVEAEKVAMAERDRKVNEYLKQAKAARGRRDWPAMRAAAQEARKLDFESALVRSEADSLDSEATEGEQQAAAEMERQKKLAEAEEANRQKIAAMKEAEAERDREAQRQAADAERKRIAAQEESQRKAKSATPRPQRKVEEDNSDRPPRRQAAVREDDRPPAAVRVRTPIRATPAPVTQPRRPPNVFRGGAPGG